MTSFNVFVFQPELVARYGYDLKTYEVLTEDGYYLPVFRIPNPQTKKGVIFLEHPLTASSTVWLDKGNVSSLGK